MAPGAGLGEAGRHVIRIGGALIVLQMTTYASSAGQVEVVVDVAIGAHTRWDSVSAGKRETGCAVVEVCVEPGIDAVAGGAIGGEAARDVTGVCG